MRAGDDPTIEVTRDAEQPQIQNDGMRYEGLRFSTTAWTLVPTRPHHSRVRVLAHIKKLEDCLGHFLVRVI